MENYYGHNKRTEMKTAKQILDDVCTRASGTPEEMTIIAMEEYATECINTLLNKCTTHHIGDEGEVRGMVLDVEKVDEFLFDNNLINELK